MSPTAQLLYVCTANLVRSPSAEVVTAVEVARRGGALLAASAGVHVGHPGAPMHPPARAALSALGYDASGMRARPLATEDVAAASLVLTATAAHRASVLELDPAALPRTVTLLEAAAVAPVLAHQMGASAPDVRPDTRTRVAMLAELALRARAAQPGRAVDLADPIGGPLPGYADTATTIVRAVHAILAALLDGATPGALVPGH